MTDELGCVIIGSLALPVSEAGDFLGVTGLTPSHISCDYTTSGLF